jgi:hypothetical protein
MTHSLVHSKKLYPVIHCVCPYTRGGIGHALRNATTAFKNGADGIFLIGHAISSTDLIYIYDQVRKRYPNKYIGVNFLDLEIGQIRKNLLLRAVNACTGLSALWTDSCPTEETGIPEWIDVFAGVAFKYKNPNPGEAVIFSQSAFIKKFASVATTSGDETGTPPDIPKLALIRSILHESLPLAVASGVTKENVSSMLPIADIFLVASSISKVRKNGEENLIGKEVRLLADKIHPRTQAQV